jgi:dienelactone hydrolase
MTPATKSATRRVAALSGALLVAIFAADVRAQELSFSAGNVGGPQSNQAGELFLPPGTGPFAAVVVLHGCNGVSPHTRGWARRLVSWGYAALIVDSFRPRGMDNVCNRGYLVPPAVRGRDAFAAAAYLRTLPNIHAKRIAVIGFSHGGGGALFAARQGAGTPFAAIIAYYPWCPVEAPAFVSDLQILIGDADDWTPAQRCLDFVGRYAAGAAHRPALKVYPGAKHSFDSRSPERIYFDHSLGHDPAAAADALALTRRFFDERLSH